MASGRLPMSRISGIIAWTAASVTWGTAVVAVVNETPAGDVKAMGAMMSPPPIEVQEEVLAPVPTLPESGLVVLRYTPVERPKPKVVVRTVTKSSPSGSAPASKPAPTRERSSGS
jgi:hypothetical protein